VLLKCFNQKLYNIVSRDKIIEYLHSKFAVLGKYVFVNGIIDCYVILKLVQIMIVIYVLEFLKDADIVRFGKE